MKKSIGSGWRAALALGALAGALLGGTASGQVAFTPSPEKPLVKGWASERVEEKLDRGMMAVVTNDKQAYVSWRLLKSDPKDVAFNVYRTVGGETVKLNEQPIAKTTDFTDAKPARGKQAEYFVRPVAASQEGAPSAKAALLDRHTDRPFISIKLQGNYDVQKVGIADLDGDGNYDYVIKQPNQNTDPYGPYWKQSTETYKLEAYNGNGQFMWRYDMGWAIERGIWYSPYLVYDFDGDGKAEVAVKSGEGDPRDPDGRVTKGPEWLTILDGATGKEVTKIPWIARDPRIGEYNHLCRNQMGVAFLDGKTPCLLMERGTYQVMVLEAYQFKNKKLEKLWHWDSDENGKTHYHQGAHFMHGCDIDGDGRDEVVLGADAIDDNGRALWTTNLGHPDKCFVGDLDPAHPGLEITYSQENKSKTDGVSMTDAKTAKKIWSIGQQTWHVGKGVCADIDPSQPGMEYWAGEDGKGDPKRNNYGGNPPRWLLSAQGKMLAELDDVPPLTNELAWWDADLLREIPIKSGVYKYGTGMIDKDIDGKIVLCADVLGDWREEIITSMPGGELRIYMTTIPAADRRACLMQDPIYRIDTANCAMGYTQPAMTSYYLGVEKPMPFDKSADKGAQKISRMANGSNPKLAAIHKKVAEEQEAKQQKAKKSGAKKDNAKARK